MIFNDIEKSYFIDTLRIPQKDWSKSEDINYYVNSVVDVYGIRLGDLVFFKKQFTESGDENYLHYVVGFGSRDTLDVVTADPNSFFGGSKQYVSADMLVKMYSFEDSISMGVSYPQVMKLSKEEYIKLAKEVNSKFLNENIIKRREINDMRRVFENKKLNNKYLKESYNDNARLTTGYDTVEDAKNIIANALCDYIEEYNDGDLFLNVANITKIYDYNNEYKLKLFAYGQDSFIYDENDYNSVIRSLEYELEKRIYNFEEDNNIKINIYKIDSDFPKYDEDDFEDGVAVPGAMQGVITVEFSI